jgi:hypothetical protein
VYQFYCGFPWNSGLEMGVSILRIADGLAYDFTTSTFVEIAQASASSVTPAIAASPVQPVMPAPEGQGPWMGSYLALMATIPAAQFTDGDYALFAHDLVRLGAGQPSVVGVMQGTCKGGTFATYFPLPVTLPATVTLNLQPPAS